MNYIYLNSICLIVLLFSCKLCCLENEESKETCPQEVSSYEIDYDKIIEAYEETININELLELAGVKYEE